MAKSRWLRIHSVNRVFALTLTLEQPLDLTRSDGSDGQKVTTGELPFITVAYGLSNIGLPIPEALTPDQIPPMPDKNERRERLDRDDIYGK